MQPSSITLFESDKDLITTLANNFGKLLVLIFYAEWNKQSMQFLGHVGKSIPVFGQYDNVRYVGVCAERCPLSFRKF